MAATNFHTGFICRATFETSPRRKGAISRHGWYHIPDHTRDTLPPEIRSRLPASRTDSAPDGSESFGSANGSDICPDDDNEIFSEDIDDTCPEDNTDPRPKDITGPSRPFRDDSSATARTNPVLGRNAVSFPEQDLLQGSAFAPSMVEARLSSARRRVACRVKDLFRWAVFRKRAWARRSEVL